LPELRPKYHPDEVSIPSNIPIVPHGAYLASGKQEPSDVIFLERIPLMMMMMMMM
jgi:hypothetical protein